MRLVQIFLVKPNMTCSILALRTKTTKIKK